MTGSWAKKKFRFPKKGRQKFMAIVSKNHDGGVERSAPGDKHPSYATACTVLFYTLYNKQCILYTGLCAVYDTWNTILHYVLYVHVHVKL